MVNIKSVIIPEELKANIDEVMEKQLFNANRYYAESNALISELMHQELDDSPDVFLRRLKERWRWHNSFYEDLLEKSFLNIIRDKHTELSPSEVEDLMNIYYTSCLVDEATLVMSGAIKKYLDHVVPSISLISEEVSIKDARTMLVTPPTETFFTRYYIDHLYYIYLLHQQDPRVYQYKTYLKETYHASDETIFRSRFNRQFSKHMDMSDEVLLSTIKGFKIPDEYKVRHFYFTLEHPDRKNIRDIILYDNLDEKLIASNLIGISGFLLRRQILKYLNDSNILSNSGYIYEFNKNTIIEALETLKMERENNMDKDVRPYKQRGNTCAVVCLMMALEYFKVMDKANWHDERRLYRVYGSRYMEGTPFSALAFHLSKNGLDTTIYHSDPNIFNNDKHILTDEAFESSLGEYKTYLDRAESTGTKIVNGTDITVELLKDKLKEGNLVILAGEVSGVLHAILLTGYNEDEFYVCDPLCKTKQTRSASSIEQFMNTGIGRWFIAVNDRTLEKTRLMDSLDEFNYEAKAFMKNKQEKKKTYEK